MMKRMQHQHGFPMARMSRAFDVPRSGYHLWQRREPIARQEGDSLQKVAIKAAHERGRDSYGADKIQEELVDIDGIMVGIHRIELIRRHLGLRCKQKRKFKATTNSKHSHPVAPNRLEQNFKVSTPSHVWVADITYIPTDER